MEKMKKFSLLTLLLFFSISMFAQTTNDTLNKSKTQYEIDRPVYPKHDWQIGMTFSNLVLQQITVDANHRYYNNQVFGIGISKIEATALSSDEEVDGNYLLERSYRGWELSAYQKIYLSRSYVDNFVYFRHGVRGDYNKYEYAREDWFETSSDGNIFLNYEKRNFSENSYRLGYEAIFGIELYHGRYSTDIFAGVAYHQQLNGSALKSDDFYIPSYQGPRPVFGFRLAINIGKTEYDYY